VERALTLLRSLGVEVTELDASERRRVNSRWLRTFARGVMEQYGGFVYRGFRWHGFSYGVEPCVEGAAALAEYQRQPPAPFYVFDERLTFCARCSAPAYPDLTSLRADLYVAHEDMGWTMAFTHEQPAIGPFFAAAPPSAVSRTS